MRTVVTALAALLLIAGLAACTTATGSQTLAPERESSDAPTAEAEAATPEASSAKDATEEATEEKPSEEPEAGKDLVVTMGGSDTTLDLTNVYCDGAPGHIEHIIAKTGHEHPLIEASGAHFVMAKINTNGAPEKTHSPSGLSYGDDSVTFTDTKVGAAVLNGTMTCTEWDD